MAETRTWAFRGHAAVEPGRRARALPLLLGMALLVAACASAPDKLADQSFYTGEPCAAPCWYGLELVSANEAQTLKLLPTLPFIDAGSIVKQATTWQTDAAAQSVLFGCAHPKASRCGTAIFSRDKLTWLELSIYYPLTTRMVVEKIGAPSQLDYTLSPDQPCSVTATWPAQHIAVVFAGAARTVCQGLRQGHGVPDNVQATSVYYTSALVLQAGPDKCCGRLAWSGFFNP